MAASYSAVTQCDAQVQCESVDFDLLPVIIEDTCESGPPLCTRGRSARPRNCKQISTVVQRRPPNLGRSRSPAESRIKISDDLEMILPQAGIRDAQVSNYRVAASFRAAARLDSHLAAMYLDFFRGDMPRNCKLCQQVFRMGELIAGYMLEDLMLRPKWIHIKCVRRARLQTVGQRVSYNPAISEATLQEALLDLGHTPRRAEKMVRWSYLPASVHRWPNQLVPAAPEPEPVEDSRPRSENSEQAIAAILAALPCSQLSSSMEACAICHQVMSQGEMICSLPCAHTYHVGCIDSWLRIRTTCPLDNRDIQQMLIPPGCKTAGESL
ncbi:rnf43 [Symbiodinium sp. CCMP2592]|nr:rnf43 [Symbiodinium sp. CCMP2592]